MELKPYPKYKDSGVEWLGEVPEHWKILQTRHLFSFGKGLTITKENLSDEGIPCINYGEIHSKYGFEFNPSDNPLKCVSHDYIESNKNCLLNEGDFIFADTSEDLEGSGNFSYLNQESIVFAGYHSIIARLKNHKNNARFFAYLFDSQAYRNQVRTEMKGVKVFSVSQGVLKSRFAWLPPNEEQVKIVSFLDSETARIDNLIAKQERLITLLEEQRKSIISHAVTKGLDPNVPMKDSGVEWLGEVPEHWKISKIKFLSKLISNKTTSKTNVIALENIESWTGKFIHTDSEFDSEAVAFEKDDVLFGKLRPYLAKVYLAPKDGQALGDIYVLRPNNLILPNFLYYSLLSTHFIDYVNSSTNGTKMPRANWDFIGATPFGLPSLEEQEQIIQHINEKWEKIDYLITKQNQLIDKLKEYRASIISHAVTGKIDVRELAP